MMQATLLFAMAAFVASVEETELNINVFQTYLTDHIGRTENRFQPAILGAPISCDKAERHALMNRGSPLHIVSPFWLLFLDHQYHYFPVPKLLTNFSSYIEISPPSLNLNKMELLTTKTVNLYVKNIHDQPITISEVMTTSRCIYIPVHNDDKVPSMGSAFVTIIVIPHEPGFFSETVFIRTSMGVIPYVIKLHAIINRRDSLTPTLHHYCAGDPVNFTMRVPNSVYGNRYSVLYDKSTFNSEKSAIKGRYITLGANIATPCSYLTFVHFVGVGMSKSLPLFLLLSKKRLQSYQPVILLDVLTTKTGYVEAEIRIVNPTDRDADVIGMEFATNVPSNIRVEAIAHSIICDRHSHTVVGRIVVTGVQEVEIETSLTITVKIGPEETAKVQLHVPVRAAVLYGDLIPDKPSIVIMPQHRVNITLQNTFQRPVALFSAKVESAVFTVDDFKPVIVNPGEWSPPISVYFHYATTTNALESYVTIYTNATKVRVPVHGYSGKVTISDVDDHTYEPMMVKDIGRALIGSTVNVTVRITNPNPHMFTISSVTTTPGIEINDNWMTEEGHTLTGLSVAPFESACVSLFIDFMQIDQKKVRNDTITLSDGVKSGTVVVSWIPISGDLTLTSDLPKMLFLGMDYSGVVSIHSSYPVTLRIRGVASNGSLAFPPHQDSVIKTAAKVPVTNVSFKITSEMFKRMRVNNIFSSTATWRKLQREWSSAWCRGVVCPVAFSFAVKANVYIRKVMFLNIDYKRLLINEGQSEFIVLGSEKICGVDIENPLAVPALFRMTSTEKDDVIDFVDNIIVVGSGEKGRIEFKVFGNKLGSRMFKIPVTSNVTAPFFTHVNVTCVEPSIEVQQNGNPVSSVSISDKITTVTLVNGGLAPMKLDCLWVKPVRTILKAFRMKTNCAHVLQSNETCQVDIFASVFQVVVPVFLTKNYTLHFRFGTFETHYPLVLDIPESIRARMVRISYLEFFLACFFPLLIPVHHVCRSVSKGRKQKSGRETAAPNKVHTFNSNHVSVATQYVAVQEKITGSSAIPLRPPAIAISMDAISDMEALYCQLHALKQ